MPKVVVQGRIAVPHADKLRTLLSSDWCVETWHPDQDELASFENKIEEALAVVGGAIPMESWPAVPNLKVFQIPWTGYEFCNPSTMPLGIPVCNCFEHETAIAEYVMAGMLEWQIGLRAMDRRFRAKGWDGHGPGYARFHGELRGRTVGVVGYGHIGREVAVRAKAFGMKTCGIRRQRAATPDELDWLGTADDLERLLGESDFVLIACDLNEATRGLIDAKRLASMKSSGVLINIARGGIVVESDLFDALQSNRIGGAIIDVWYNYAKPDAPEPWPSNLPFQDLSNVILSAHESGWTQEQVARRWQFVAANLERVARGETPANIVFHGSQQPS